MVALICGSLVLLGRELRRKKKEIGGGWVAQHVLR